MAQYKLSCADIGDRMCDFVTTGNSPEEVKQNMFSHAQAAHPDKMQSMTESEMKMANEMMDKLLAAQS